MGNGTFWILRSTFVTVQFDSNTVQYLCTFPQEHLVLNFYLYHSLFYVAVLIHFTHVQHSSYFFHYPFRSNIGSENVLKAYHCILKMFGLVPNICSQELQACNGGSIMESEGVPWPQWYSCSQTDDNIPTLSQPY